MPVELSGSEVTARSLITIPPVATDAVLQDSDRDRAYFFRVAAVFTVLVAVALSAFGLWIFKTQAHQAPVPQIHSIAVLPLRNLSRIPGRIILPMGLRKN